MGKSKFQIDNLLRLTIITEGTNNQIQNLDMFKERERKKKFIPRQSI